MKEIKYRKLSPIEKKRASEQEAMHTKYEEVAYMMLPEIMRKNLKKNSSVAFADFFQAYYPDFFLGEEMIIIEIDGEYHKHKWREGRDATKDEVFKKHGFTVIRIVNRDTLVNVAFWQLLIEGLERSEEMRPEILAFIYRLRKMVKSQIHAWTKMTSNPHIYGEDSFNKQMEFMAKLLKKCKVKRIKKRKKKGEIPDPYLFY